MQLIWHRADLRLHDHPALATGLAHGPVVGVVILDPQNLAKTSPRRRAWFVDHVRSLRHAYRQRGGHLVVRRGDPAAELPQLVAALAADAVHAVASYTPYGRERDAKAEAALGVPLHRHGGNYVHEPGQIKSDAGQPYSVYTPFSKRWWATPWASPEAAPEKFPAVTLAIDEGELPDDRSDIPLPPHGESAALAALDAFLADDLDAYPTTRDRLDGRGCSHLAWYFNVGALSPRLAARRAMDHGGDGARKWVAELAWRDFMADVLLHRPQMLAQPFDARWSRFTWTDDPAALAAWTQGCTGIPVIDAAMRELQATGFMSNRCRMVTAQFLTKLLLVHWTKGERVFKDWLLDGDTSQNVGNWQWASGMGVDAAPYFRVFNPVSQGKEHDPDGAWIKKWVPESNGDPAPLPHAIVDLAEARKRYLAIAAEVSRK